MAQHWPRPGINHVGEYQASGHSLVITGSAKTIYLKHVASSITVSATSAADLTIFDGLHEGFGFTVPENATATFKGKFLTFKVPANMDALVEITNIPSGSYRVPSRAEIFRTS